MPCRAPACPHRPSRWDLHQRAQDVTKYYCMQPCHALDVYVQTLPACSTAVHHPVSRWRRLQRARAERSGCCIRYCATHGYASIATNRTSIGLSHDFSAPAAQSSARTCSAESGGWFPSVRRLACCTARSRDCSARARAGRGMVASAVQGAGMCSATTSARACASVKCSLFLTLIRTVVKRSGVGELSQRDPNRVRAVLTAASRNYGCPLVAAGCSVSYLLGAASGHRHAQHSCRWPY